MNKTILYSSVTATLAIALIITIIAIKSSIRAKKYSYSIDSIYLAYKDRIDALTDVVDGGVGSDGDPMESGLLINELRKKCSEKEFIALSKNANPHARMVAICCLKFYENEEYIFSFHSDSGMIHYRSGCTINRKMPIGAVITQYWFNNESPRLTRILWKRLIY